MENSLVYFFLGLLAAVPFLFLWRQVSRDCPNCHRQLPMFYAPWNRTRRQWVNGGYVCEVCQIEVNLEGKAISPESAPVSSVTFWKVMTLSIVGPVLVIIVSYFVLHWAMPEIKQWAMAGHGSPASTQQQEQTNATGDLAIEPSSASLPSGRSVEFVKSSGNVVRPSAADLSMYHSGPFRPDEISSSPDAAKTDAYLSSFAAHLSEQARRDAGRRFDESMIAIDRGSPEKYEASINRIIQTTADLPAIYRAMLMFNLMMDSHECLGSKEARHVGFDGTLYERIKHNCAMTGLAKVDEIPVGLALRFLEFGTHSQLTSNTDNDPDWPEQRRLKAMLWLTQIDKVRRAIDPLWEENDVPQLNVEAPDGLPSGASPQAVRDPKVRADYEQRIKAHRIKAERYTQQLLARRLLAYLSPRIEEDLIRLYARKPLKLAQIETLLEQHSSDQLERSRVAKTVRLINDILPNGTQLKYGWPDALTAAGKNGVPQLIAAVNDKSYPRFIRHDGAWALGLIGDPRAIPVLTEVAEDTDTPDKYKDIACEFVRAINAATIQQQD